MTFCIISHVPHGKLNGHYFAYSPYVSEMNIWSTYVDKIVLVAPLNLTTKTAINLNYTSKNIDFRAVNKFDLLNFKNALQSFYRIPKIILKLYKAMKQADHIHLRCPGNIGLLGALVQILFPNKPKTAKYAGNWDPAAQQPWSYQLQKWLLSNTFLTKNMQVLVYGNWPNQTNNIKPFFTATYYKNEIIKTPPRILSEPLQFIFVGTLTANKRPLWCIKVVHQLKIQGYQVQLSLYGEGSERSLLEHYIFKNHLQHEVVLKGNVSKDDLKNAYQKSHFLLFFSKSEGWPKAVAEAMFWGCVPITTSVSCVSDMLGNGTRGVLVEADKNEINKAIKSYLNNTEIYKIHAQNGMDWSQQYTLDLFENEIEKLLI